MYFVLGQRFLPNFFLNCKLDNAKRSRGGGRINTSFWLASFSDAKQLYRRPFPVHHRAVLPLLISHILLTDHFKSVTSSSPAAWSAFAQVF